ncbi:MAG: DUF429 domain-containing protein [Polyangiales bacterium]
MTLAALDPVQALPGTGHPFDNLVSLLRFGGFDGAGVDASFLIQRQFTARGHAALLSAVAALPLNGRPFPEAKQFVAAVAGYLPPLNPPKPMRATELVWGVSARSTLWAGARGGAAMTAACLMLLARTGSAAWPWTWSGSRLLVEAFPAAQLRHWNLPHVKYNGADPIAAANRAVIVRALGARLSLGHHLPRVLGNADALDAVLCAFAARAACSGTVVKAPGAGSQVEGWIAVHP